ncbi:methyltransferase domain-containing protein [Candidatus Pacearchaeota archaeon]|nr:methyltransferase domain-containing protein [Candidatus Pacearchaeota archaeon]MBD3283446.1 methyltransferase domain-containing protein [Candidatus Pacearchaeota archaeon]
MDSDYDSHYKRALKLIQEYAYEREEYEDRDVLERIIIPYLLSKINPKKILDVRREDYQKFYNLFFKGRELWTIDKNPKRKKYGSENHITDDVVNIKNYFSENSFDLIIMNGVFGWGLNKPEDVEKTILSFYKILRKGGIFVFGWNDIPDLKPLELENIESLKKFKPYFFEPLKTISFKSLTEEHTYSFFIKE